MCRTTAMVIVIVMTESPTMTRVETARHEGVSAGNCFVFSRLRVRDFLCAYDARQVGGKCGASRALTYISGGVFVIFGPRI